MTEPKNPPTLDEIKEEAFRVAGIYAAGYGRTMTWAEWSMSARDDFWSIAQDNFDIPDERQIPLPEELS